MSVLLKYCGHRSLADLQKGAQSAAHYLGLIFAESKRKVEVSQVKQWLEAVELNGKKLVGVFVNSELEYIRFVAHSVPLSVIQCHGHETVEQVAAIKKATNCLVWKVIHHREGALGNMKKYARVVDGYVVDSRVNGAWGGTGVAFDWDAVPFYIEEANRQGVPCFIAGGIAPHNIDRLLSYQPHGIDISSGIEENGEKSMAKMIEIEKKVMHSVRYAK